MSSDDITEPSNTREKSSLKTQTDIKHLDFMFTLKKKRHFLKHALLHRSRQRLNVMLILATKTQDVFAASL